MHQHNTLLLEKSFVILNSLWLSRPFPEMQSTTSCSATGQTKPTRIIRLLTGGTIEKSILAHQRNKLQTPGQGQTGVQLQEAELLAGNTLADLLAAHP